MNETRHREIISGEARGPTASLARISLAGLSLAYRLGVAARNLCYTAGLKKSHFASVPVISVGNVTAGGTGKTPTVAWIADWFVQRQVRVALLSRGYRAMEGHANDEKLVLDRLLPGVPHIQQPDRVAAAHRATVEERAELLVLDDGFQHRRLARDLDIVLVDALNPWGYGRLLPAGLLREPISALARADVVVITRADQVSIERRQEIASVIRKYHTTTEPVAVAFRPECLIDVAGRKEAFETLAGQSVGSFCGIGNPAGFRQTIAGLGVELAWEKHFPDHHHYSEQELTLLTEQAEQSGVTAVLTTEKDLVKLDGMPPGRIPIWSVRISARIVDGAEVLEAAFERIRSRLSAQ